ncbi:hypothetical protein KJ966_08315 [bacterium]|nr:hypothetical protein [bacterium]
MIKRLIEGGVQVNSALSIISEVGNTLESFPNATALCRWADVCLVNNGIFSARFVHQNLYGAPVDFKNWKLIDQYIKMKKRMNADEKPPKSEKSG